MLVVGDGDDGVDVEEADRRGSSGECVEWRGRGGDGRRRIRGDAGLQATVVAHDDDERVRLGDEWKTERIGGRGGPVGGAGERRDGGDEPGHRRRVPHSRSRFGGAGGEWDRGGGE